MENLEDMEVDQLDGLDVPEGAGELSLPRVVVREILENLSSTDCLNVSRVNKDWHYEAFSVLRRRGSLTAKMNSADGRCKDLRAFGSDLRRMTEVRKVIPFSGLTIAIADDEHGDYCEESSAGELDQIYVDILHQMDFKHLALDLSRHAVRGENCAGFKLVKKVLQNRSVVLQEFSLEIGSNRQAFIQHFLQDCNFSSLTTLNFQGAPYAGDEDFIKTLVSRSPNLKVLSTNGRLNLRANLLEGRAAAVVHAIHDSFNLSFYDEIPESAVGRLRLRSIWLMYRSYRQDFNLQKFDRMTRMMLQTSRSTLSSILVDAMYLVPWTNYEMHLRNVRRLDVILYQSDASEPRLRRLLKSFDFSRVFPNLSAVKISGSQILLHPSREHERNAIIDMVEQGNAGLISPLNPTANIKRLHLSWSPSVPASYTRFLAQMFPHLKKLVIHTLSPSLFARFWDHWEELEELDFTLEVHEGDVDGNLDSGICGIFPEEVAQLREQGEKYLESANIVPVMPSLCSFKRLRTLNVYFCGLHGIVDVHPTSTISKVSEWIAFRRCPGLTVTLETNRDSWRQELDRMEPYATVQLTHRFGSSNFL